MQKFFEIDEIGIIEFRKYKGSKRIKILIKPNAEVKVTLPFAVSFGDAISFVNEKKGWILQNLQRLNQKKQQNFIFTNEVLKITKNHDLFLTKNSHKQFYLSVRNNKIELSYPEELQYNDLRLQKAINKGIEIALKKEAIEYIPQRIKYLSQEKAIFYNHLKINSAKTKWGSCTSLNTINISLHIMRLPEHLIDYVLLHELAHVKVKNHSKDFWIYLDSLSENSKLQNKELKQYRIPRL